MTPLIHEIVHVFLSHFIGLLEFVVHDLTMVQSEATLLPPQSHYLVYHVEFVVRDLRLRIEFYYLLTLWFKLIIDGRGKGSWWWLIRCLFLITLFTIFELSEVVFVNNVMLTSNTFIIIVLYIINIIELLHVSYDDQWSYLFIFKILLYKITNIYYLISYFSF